MVIGERIVSKCQLLKRQDCAQSSWRWTDYLIITVPSDKHPTKTDRADESNLTQQLHTYQTDLSSSDIWGWNRSVDSDDIPSAVEIKRPNFTAIDWVGYTVNVIMKMNYKYDPINYIFSKKQYYESCDLMLP